jgi:hypothetical protein
MWNRIFRYKLMFTGKQICYFYVIISSLLDWGLGGNNIKGKILVINKIN